MILFQALWIFCTQYELIPHLELTNLALHMPLLHVEQVFDDLEHTQTKLGVHCGPCMGM